MRLSEFKKEIKEYIVEILSEDEDEDTTPDEDTALSALLSIGKSSGGKTKKRKNRNIKNKTKKRKNRNTKNKTKKRKNSNKKRHTRHHK